MDIVYVLNIQKKQSLTIRKDSFCATYCSWEIQLIRVVGIDFKSAV